MVATRRQTLPVVLVSFFFAQLLGIPKGRDLQWPLGTPMTIAAGKATQTVPSMDVARLGSFCSLDDQLLITKLPINIKCRIPTKEECNQGLWNMSRLYRLSFFFGFMQSLSQCQVHGNAPIPPWPTVAGIVMDPNRQGPSTIFVG